MTKKHEVSNLIFAASKDDMGSFFDAAVRTICSLDKLYEVLVAFEDGDFTEDEVYDELVEYEFVDTNVLLTVGRGFVSITDSYNKYLNRTADVYEVLVSNVMQLVGDGRDPDNDDVDILKKEIAYVIGGLSYFLVCDFNIADTLKHYNADASNYEIDEVFDSYVKFNGLAVDDACMLLIEFSDRYKFRLDFFDGYPELEEPFMEITGPDYNLIPEGSLTIDIVKGIIEGKVRIDDFLESLNME